MQTYLIKLKPVAYLTPGFPFTSLALAGGPCRSTGVSIFFFFFTAYLGGFLQEGPEDLGSLLLLDGAAARVKKGCLGVNHQRVLDGAFFFLALFVFMPFLFY